MWDLPILITLAVSGLLALLLIVDWQMTGYLRRFLQAQPARKPLLIDLAAETPEGVDDTRPTWLMLTRATPEWNPDTVAEICARVWNVPVNQHEHDFNFVIGEAPCLMLRHGDWHYLLTIGDEPYMDPEQIPDSADATLRQAFAAQQSWFSLSVVGVPDNETLQGREALHRSGALVAALAGDLGLVLLGASSTESPVGSGGWTWYNGSSSWMYLAGLESIFGFQLRGERVTLAPRIPADWPGFEIQYRHHKTPYRIRFVNLIAPANASNTHDEHPLADNNFELIADGKEHTVVIYRESGAAR